MRCLLKSHILGVLLLAMVGWFATWTQAAENEKPSAKEDSSTSQMGPVIKIRNTCADGGPSRTNEAIPGDILYFTITVIGMDVASSGNIEGCIFSKILNDSGEVVEKLPDVPVEMKPWFENARVTENIHWQIPRNFHPGNYEIRFAVRDENENEIAVQTYSLQVLPKNTFGAILPRFSHPRSDFDTQSGVFAVGTETSLLLMVVGSTIQDNKICVESKITVIDKDGDAVSVAPIISTHNHKPTSSDGADLAETFAIKEKLQLSRPGKFVIHVELLDKLGKKNATYEFPIIVATPP
jgi:hypothetical protein